MIAMIKTSRILALGSMALAILACTKAPSSKKTPAEQESMSNTAPSENAARPASPASPASNAQNTKVPGWLALAVQPRDKRAYGWTPAHPNATAVILDADAWSETVDEETPFRLIAREGNLAARFSEVSQIPYGCEDTPMTMAAFRAPHDLAEQVVWILPESHANAAAIAIKREQLSRASRTWTMGNEWKIEVHARGEFKGQLVVRRGKNVVHEREFEKPLMDGVERTAIDLSSDMETGVPYPEAAVQIDDKTAILIVRIASYEGVTFEIFTLGDSLVRARQHQYYVCAV
jgi:hypothetical protein